MLVHLTNSRATIVGALTAPERAFLQETLSFEDQSTKFTGANAQSKVSLYNSFSNVFPAGLLSLVMRTAAKHSPPVRIEYVDTRVKPCEPDPDYAETFTPDFQSGGRKAQRSYQIDAVKAVWARTRGVLQLPTGAGKTTIAVAVIRSLPCRWLFVVDSTHLMEDAANRYREMTGEECGIIGDGQFTTGKVTFATFQTIASRIDQPAMKEYLNSVRGLIVDEAHTLGADTFYTVANALPNAYYRVGLSGTPLSRTDRRSILVTAAMGSLIYTITPGELTAMGYLAMPRITMLEVSQAGGWDLHYSRFRALTIVSSKRRNAAVLEAIERVEKPALVFIKEIAHGRHILDLIHTRTGFNARLVYGEQDVAVRKQAVAALERRDCDIIVCSTVFTKGVDIPFLRGGVNAAGGKSEIDAIQRLGRGLRITKDKSTFDWYDIADKGHPWLVSHTDDRFNSYLIAGYTPHRETSIQALKHPDQPIVKGKKGKAPPEKVEWSSGDEE